MTRIRSHTQRLRRTETSQSTDHLLITVIMELSSPEPNVPSSAVSSYLMTVNVHINESYGWLSSLMHSFISKYSI